MAISKIYKGQDVPIRITVKNKNGVAVDLSEFEGIIVILFFTKTRKALERFSLNSLTDFLDLEIIDAANGILEFKLESGSTENAEDGLISVEIKTQLSDPEYTDSKFHTVAVAEDQFELKEAITVVDGAL